MSKNWIYILTILIFSLIGMKALFHPGLYTAHDIWHQVVRFYYYSQAVNDGQFPPYWIGQLANRFGYPLFFFSYHLPWILGVLLLKIGVDFFSSIKILFFLSYLVSGITMYFFVKSLLKDNLAALLSSILYLWLPYHFLITFVSASVGIAFVFSFLPLIFLGIYNLAANSSLGILILALGLTGIILSHIIHLVFLLPVILIFTVWVIKCAKSKILLIKNLFFGAVLAIFLSSFYLLPASYYNQSTRVHQEEGVTSLFERNFITLKQLVYSKWGFSPIVNNAKNEEISFQLGIAQWISLCFLVGLIIMKKLSKHNNVLSIYLLAGFAISIFLMLDYSSNFWKFLVKYMAVDFPFRLLLPATFIASICSGIVLTSIPKRFKSLTFLLLILIAIYTNRNHLNVNQYTDFPITTYLNLETEITTNTFNEYLPIGANPKLLNKPWNEIIGGDLSFSNTRQQTNSLSFDINVPKQHLVAVGQFYFPGQTLYLDNQVSQFTIDKDGRISFMTPEGVHKVSVKYQEPPLIKFSKILTTAGILIALIMFIYSKKFTRKAYF